MYKPSANPDAAYTSIYLFDDIAMSQRGFEECLNNNV